MNLSMLVWSILCLIIMLLGLGGVAFVTLLERKLLGLSQIRLGPNKVTLLGLLQPVADGVKLLFKEFFFVEMSQGLIFMMSPALLLVVFLLLWVWVLPWWVDFFMMKYSGLFLFMVLGISAYTVILVGWSSTSAFSKLGSLRGMLQSLSFEVALILSFLVLMMQYKTMTLMVIREANLLLEWNIVWGLLWFILSLMETNRAPFDLLEGESELISGFNIELGSVLFVFLFLSEYGMIIVLMLFMSMSTISLNIFSILFVCLLLFMRSCFPRVRYDIMMSMMWLVILPFTIFYFLGVALL